MDEDLRARSEDELRHLTSSKWSRYPRDVIPAWVAEMDFETSPEVMRSARTIVDKGDFGYPLRDGDKPEKSVARAFAAYAGRAFGWQVDVEQVEPVAELIQAIYLSVMAFTNPGDGVLLLTPSYPPLRDAVIETGRRLIPVGLIAGQKHFEIDFDRLEESIDSGTRLLLLCNPQNPTGRVFTSAELTRLAAIAERRDLMVISDEIHADLVYGDAKHVPFASLGDHTASRTVTLASTTKTFNTAGLRCGIMYFGTARLHREFLKRFPRRSIGTPSAIGMDATVAAWSEGADYTRRIVEKLTTSRDLATSYLSEKMPQIQAFVPEATYLYWLDCRKLRLSETAHQFFLREAKVALSPGETFDAAAEGYVRLNFATSPPILLEILDRLALAASKIA